jgi:hypothetical protein
MAQYAIIAEDGMARDRVFGPCASEQDAADFIDEFGGDWMDWCIVELEPISYNTNPNRY